jgi:hypothetical protein
VCSEQHPGEDRARIVLRRRRHDLTQRIGQRGRGHGDAGGRHLGQSREVVRRQRAQRGGEATGLDARVLVLELHRHGVGIEPGEDVGEQPRRQDDTAFAFTLRRCGDPDRQLEVGSHELDGSLTQAHPQPGQHRQRAGAGRHGALCGRHGLGQRLTLGTELHGVLLIASGIGLGLFPITLFELSLRL